MIVPISVTVISILLFAWFIFDAEGEDVMAIPIVMFLAFSISTGSWLLYALWRFVGWYFG